MPNTALALRPHSHESAVMLTGAQIRAARALLRWSAKDLAGKCGVSYASVQRVEGVDGIPNMQTRNLMAIKAALESGGVEFLDGPYSGSGGPGVRLRE